MKRKRILRWCAMAILTAVLVISFLFLFVLPFAGSLLITNGNFRFHERGPTDPKAVGLPVTPVEFRSTDGIPLRGWWSPGDALMPAIIFVHGLNRSRLELLERAAESNRRGYGVLLFDLRNHGESGRAHTTLGINEANDVCAAGQFVRDQAPDRLQVLWGVSMGASSAVLAAQKCPGFSAVISDSSFLSFRDTIAHHVTLFFRVPAFPIANLISLATEIRTGIDADDGDVQAAVRQLEIPILFIAGGADRRMPPMLAAHMFAAARSRLKQLVTVPGAGHGEAFASDRSTYLQSVFRFLESVAIHVHS
jgi:pimeloyl-ACP methyl ester carboxylesterase